MRMPSPYARAGGASAADRPSDLPRYQTFTAQPLLVTGP